MSHRKRGRKTFKLIKLCVNILNDKQNALISSIQNKLRSTGSPDVMGPCHGTVIWLNLRSPQTVKRNQTQAILIIRRQEFVATYSYMSTHCTKVIHTAEMWDSRVICHFPCYNTVSYPKQKFTAKNTQNVRMFKAGHTFIKYSHRF